MATAAGQGAQTETLAAIAAREHRRIRAELKERRRRRPEPEVPAAGWSTKPDKSKRRKGTASEVDQRAVANRGRWARRHPQLAKEERLLRKERKALLDRWGHKNDGTPETHERASRRHQGSLVELYQRGHIDAEQLAAAVEIAQVHERIGADVTVKTASLETRVDITRMGDGSFFERLGHVQREIAYTRWRREAEGPIGAVLDMIVGEPEGFTVVAVRYRIHHRKAKRLLVDALSLWPKILGAVCKEVDRKDLERAQSRVLA